jgi:hypothetical protein
LALNGVHKEEKDNKMNASLSLRESYYTILRTLADMDGDPASFFTIQEKYLKTTNFWEHLDRMKLFDLQQYVSMAFESCEECPGMDFESVKKN